MSRFQVEKKGTVYNNIVDIKQPKPNGPGIIASSHSDEWAQTIVDALNYVDGLSNAPDKVLTFPNIPKPPTQEADHDT